MNGVIIMGLIRCPNGHMFSERRYGSICPYCNIDTKKLEEKRKIEPEEIEEIEKNLLYQEVEPEIGRAHV